MSFIKEAIASLFHLFFPPEEGDKELSDAQIWGFGVIILIAITVFILVNNF